MAQPQPTADGTYWTIRKQAGKFYAVRLTIGDTQGAPAERDHRMFLRAGDAATVACERAYQQGRASRPALRSKQGVNGNSADAGIRMVTG